MSQPKEIYVKGTTATSVDNYMYLSQSREMIGWDKYHHNDIVEELKEIARAVAHIGVDFGYGKYEIEDKYTQSARKLLEALK